MVFKKYDQQHLLKMIKRKVEKGNLDNISRTVFYQQFYFKHQEIKWAFLASMVSRNAGWNMTDLEGELFQRSLPKQYRDILFYTYERANWLIFEDAYPQLLIYEESKKRQQPLFFLLKDFHVSAFMEKEWIYFWTHHDVWRLCYALIINEQHVIQKPVIEHPFYKKHVFHSLPFYFEDRFHFSTVLFPTVHGELYGFSVHHFTNVKSRIKLGKKLTWLLFFSPVAHQFICFAKRTEHTGSRCDYEQYLGSKRWRKTPFLRLTFPVIEHHRERSTDWYNKWGNINKLFKPVKEQKKYRLTAWYFKKEQQLQAGVEIYEFFFGKNNL
ncbi:DUF2515 domain-containing protein [Anaerobacillus sp. MEB173]|uniref:DUF2515 domain-containing protein n=1 Tax=Anaerobacillus sp. MEB173 TaxID=3383345 RepID=UPI003F93486D